MKQLPTGADVSEIDKGVKNKWRWAWMQERNSDGICYEVWCRKIDSPGVCFCVPCNKTIVYGSGGKKALCCHSDDPDHKRNVKNLMQTTKLAGVSKTTVTPDGLVDRVSELKSVVCMFIAEHCLPFSLGEDLVQLAKRLGNDGKALNALSLSRGSTTYSTVHGVAHALKEELKAKLAKTTFSLNVDEATNAKNDKVVNVLVQYFDGELGKVVAEHLGSREVNVATADNIYNDVSQILSDSQLGWGQVVSCLMDNCNTMRGKKGGVEALIKKNERGNEHLLDIGGENIHVIHTSASAMFKVFDEKFLPLQDLAMDIYYDIEQSPKASQLFQDIQEHLTGTKAKKLIRPISNRFLQMKDVADRMTLLMDSLIMYYSAFLTSEEQKKLAPEQDNMFTKYSTPEASKVEINKILNTQRKQEKSSTSKDRKERILLYLFNKRKELQITVELYRGVLNQFSGFVKLFQSEKPLAHKLHSEMFTLTKTFFALFIDPSYLPVPGSSASDLYALDLEDCSIHLRDSLLGVGEFCLGPLQECLRDKKKNHWLNSFFKGLRSAFIAGAKGLLKMPLLNKNLSNLSCLDPGEQRSSTTQSAFMELAKLLPNVVPIDKLGQLDGEVRRYVCDEQVTYMDADETAPDFRLDADWWGKIFTLKDGFGRLRYPVLTELVKALISIFAGPVVEGSFNIMGDIIAEDRSSLTTFNYEALAIIKRRLQVSGQHAVTIQVPQKMKQSVQTSWKRYNDMLEKKKNENQHLCPSSKQTSQQSMLEQKSTDKTKPGTSQLQLSEDKRLNQQKQVASESRKVSSSTRMIKEISSKNKPSTSDVEKMSHNDISEDNQSNSGKSFYHRLSQKLETAAKSSFYDLRCLAKKAERQMKTLSLHNLNAKHYLPDPKAEELCPKDCAHLTPVTVYGDGNCLPRCCSLLACGTQELYEEMRARIVVELAAHSEFYLDSKNLQGIVSTTPSTCKSDQPQDLTKIYASYSDNFNMEVLTPSTIRRIFEAEVCKATVPGSYMGIWQMHAISSILKTEIQSVYPEYGGHSVRKHLHKTLVPREKFQCSPSHEQSSFPAILWTRVKGKDLPETTWRPNHFVICLPRDAGEGHTATQPGPSNESAQGLSPVSTSFVESSDRKDKKRKIQGVDIRAFFSKRSKDQ